jgi:hypothetical protein
MIVILPQSVPLSAGSVECVRVNLVIVVCAVCLLYSQKICSMHSVNLYRDANCSDFLVLSSLYPGVEVW